MVSFKAANIYIAAIQYSVNNFYHDLVIENDHQWTALFLNILQSCLLFCLQFSVWFSVQIGHIVHAVCEWNHPQLMTLRNNFQGTPRSLKVFEFNSCKFKALKSPGIWFVGFGKFSLDNGRPFIWTFRHVTSNSGYAVFSFDYLLQIEVEFCKLGCM